MSFDILVLSFVILLINILIMIMFILSKIALHFYNKKCLVLTAKVKNIKAIKNKETANKKQIVDDLINGRI